MMHYAATIGNADSGSNGNLRASPGFYPHSSPVSPPSPFISLSPCNYQGRGMRVNLAYCEFELKINSWLARADLSIRMASEWFNQDI